MRVQDAALWALRSSRRDRRCALCDAVRRAEQGVVDDPRRGDEVTRRERTQGRERSNVGLRLLGTAAAVLLLVGSVHAQSEPSPGDTLPATTARQIEALLVRKAQRTPAQRKISAQLLDTRQPGQSQPAAVVTVDIRADVTTEVLARIRTLGGTVLSSVPKYRAIRARLPLAAVEPLATLDAVQSIRPADQAQTRGVRRAE